MNKYTSTIVALATPLGSSAIAVIRLSGQQSIALVKQVFEGKDLTQQPSHTIHFGTIYDQHQPIDEVLVALFVAPYSFTKENSVEISCHGSAFIIEQLIQLLITMGARPAEPGEFTKRAFLNGRFDLAQAEAVADLIAADSTLSHQTALKQMRGGLSTDLKNLRTQLLDFSSMLALELDFSEEDVEFLDREALYRLARQLDSRLQNLIESFALGNVIKEGVTVTIIGKPNGGKSTLLNQLLGEERAITSPIAGTTRDAIEATLHLEGIRFRFIDTAGLRTMTHDPIEAKGIEKTKEKLQQATVILYVVDISETSCKQAETLIQSHPYTSGLLFRIGNKVDVATEQQKSQFIKQGYTLISAHHKSGGQEVKACLKEWLKSQQTDGTIVVNIRHYAQLQKGKEAIEEVMEGLSQRVTSDCLAVDLQKAAQALGEITGEVSTDEVLANIFSKFCIGK